MYLLHVPIAERGHVASTCPRVSVTLCGKGTRSKYVSPRDHRARVHLRDSQMKRTQPVTLSEPSGLSWSVDL